jgi:hypothetical protein
MAQHLSSAPERGVRCVRGRPEREAGRAEYWQRRPHGESGGEAGRVVSDYSVLCAGSVKVQGKRSSERERIREVEGRPREQGQKGWRINLTS